VVAYVEYCMGLSSVLHDALSLAEDSGQSTSTAFRP